MTFIFAFLASHQLSSLKDYISQQDLNGNTPLEMACYKGCDEVADLLLRNGVDLSPVTKEGVHLTPMHVAAKDGHVKVVDLLVSHGSKVDVLNDELKTPLHRLEMICCCCCCYACTCALRRFC